MNETFFFPIVPDVTKGDNIFSEYFMSFQTTGFYSSVYHLYANDDTLTRSWIGPSFYINEAINPGEDKIPPSRITDLSVTTYENDESFITLSWTAPGGNLNQGKGSMIYYILEIVPDRHPSFIFSQLLRGTLRIFASRNNFRNWKM